MNTPAIALEPAPQAGHAAASPPRAACQVEIVVPVRDEEADLAAGVRRLHAYLTGDFPFTARITIADNGSTDGTWAVARELAATLDRVTAVRLAQPGRGRALRAIWSASDSAVLGYMDVDLSTDLNALLPLVAPLLSGHRRRRLVLRHRAAGAGRGAARVRVPGQDAPGDPGAAGIRAVLPAGRAWRRCWQLAAGLAAMLVSGAGGSRRSC
ncbi:MAG TPA: glycosyltransferase [Streptosporangiaceae bacterium]